MVACRRPAAVRLALVVATAFGAACDPRDTPSPLVDAGTNDDAGPVPEGPACVPPAPVEGALLFTECFCTASGFCPELASLNPRAVSVVQLIDDDPWFVTEPFLARWRDGVFERAVLPGDLPVYAAAALSEEEVWIASAAELLHFHGASLERFEAEGIVRIVAKAADEVYFVRSLSPPLYFDGTTLHELPPFPPLPPDAGNLPPRILDLDALGPADVWLVGFLTAAPVLHFDGQAWSWHRVVGDAMNSWTTAVHLRPDGEAWLLGRVGFDRGGNAYHLVGETFLRVELPEAPPLHQWTSLATGPAGGVWVAAYDARLIGRVDSGVFAPRFQAPARFTSLVVSDQEVLWAGAGFGGFFRGEGTELQELATPLPGLVTGAVRLPGDRLVFFFYASLPLLYHEGGWSPLEPAPPWSGVSYLDAPAVVDEATGRLWVARDNELFRFDEEGWTSVPLPFTYQHRLRLALDPANEPWVESEGKVWRRHEGGWLGVRDAPGPLEVLLPVGSDEAYAIFEGLLWRLRDKNWHLLANNEGATGLLRGPNGEVWASGTPVRLLVGDQLLPQGLNARGLTLGPDGALWAFDGTDPLVLRRRDASGWSEPLEAPGSSWNHPELLVPGDGALWVVGYDTLYRRPPGLPF